MVSLKITNSITFSDVFIHNTQITLLDWELPCLQPVHNVSQVGPEATKIKGGGGGGS